MNAREFDLELYSVECTRKRTKQELSFLHVTLLLDLIYVPPKYYQIISDSMGYSLHKISDPRETDNSYFLLCTCLARDTPTGPYLCVYQISSKYVKPLRSYRVHKNLS